MKMKTEPGFTWVPPTELERRINTIPLPKKVKSSFSRIVLSWQHNSGTGWTVSRLKSFKDCLLNSYSEGGKKISHKPEWFSTTPSGRLAGVFGDLWVIAMSGAANLRAVLNLVNIYTGSTNSDWNQAVLEEITTSVEREPVILPKRSHVSTKPALNWAFKALKKLGWKGKLQYRRKPYPITWQLPGKGDHVKRVPSDIRMAEASCLALPNHARHLLHEATGAWLAPYVPPQWFTIVGDIHMTHEPGLKTRYFAAPNLVYQQALEPLKCALLDFLRGVPWDCTVNQRKADKRILSALSQHQRVFSVDLSKATDAFPWEWQKAVLQNLTEGYEARAGLALFQAIIEQGSWELPDGSPVTFKAGQPLGLGPSFPAFTLAHGVLLYALNGYKWDEDFYVLGDDVIIFNDLLHSKYREVLSRWKVDVSEAKSFSSVRLAQFAGMTYTDKGSFWIPKWRPFTGTNILDLAAWWYPGLTKGFPDHSLIERVLSLPAPYGIGRNPEGLPLEERFTQPLVDELISLEKRREAEAKASVTRFDSMKLFDALRKAGRREDELLLFYSRITDDVAFSVAERCISHNFKLNPTGFTLPAPLRMLAHETEVLGCPRVRYRAPKVDPYTLGSLKVWKRTFKRVDTVKQSV